MATAIVLDGQSHRPCPPAEGIGLHGASQASLKPTLRIASFNIHGCRDAQGNQDLERTANALQDFDLIGLNEVHGARPWTSCDQAQALGERLQMPWLFAPTTRRWWRDDFGNGLLCSLPVSRWRRVPLSGTRHKGHRNVIIAEVDHGGRTVQVIVAHLDRVQDRQRQLVETIDTFLALPEPAILLGDLNTMADDAQLAQLLASPGIHDVVAEGLSHPPPRRIDWILARGLRGVRSGVVDTKASDHPLVWAEVEACETELARRP
jgi:endonuclease/exonuclease/phosphatase family metal-dependent hydrolase